MYSLQARIKPAQGAAGDLRKLLKQWTKKRQEDGDRTTLLEVLWGHEGPEFKTTTLHKSISKAAKTRARMLQDEKFVPFASQLATLIREQVSWSLKEIIVAPGVPLPAKYVIHVTMHAAIGRNADLRRLMTNWCEKSNENGMSLALGEELWSARGGTFGVRVPFRSLKQAEKSRKKLNQDSDYRQLGQNLKGVLDGPSRWEMLHVISTSS